MSEPPAEKPGAEAPEPVGVVRKYADLVEVARAQRERLNISFSLLDELAGIPNGYSSKVLSPDEPRKHFGHVSFDAIMGALGLKFVAVQDDEQLARLRPRMVERDSKQVRHRRK